MRCAVAAGNVTAMVIDITETDGRRPASRPSLARFIQSDLRDLAR